MTLDQAAALLDQWEAEEHAAPRPCPDMLRTIAACRANLEGSLSYIEGFAAHMASLETEAAQ